MSPTEIILFGLATAFIGYLIGNWLAVGRDKRREFNELIADIRHDLIGIRNYPSSELRGTWMITFTLICERLPVWKRKGFDMAIETYRHSKSTYYRNRKPDGCGGFCDGEGSAEDRMAIIRAVNGLLKYLKPR